MANLLGEEIPQIWAACGRGARSTLRVLRPGLAVTEMAVSPLPGNPTAGALGAPLVGARSCYRREESPGQLSAGNRPALPASKAKQSRRRQPPPSLVARPAHATE